MKDKDGLPHRIRPFPPSEESDAGIVMTILLLLTIVMFFFFVKVAEQGWPSWLSWIWS